MHRGGAAERSQHAKKKLTARERIDRLLDAGSFTELDLFAVHRTTAFGMEDRKIRGDGVVTGWGTVEGRQVFVFSHDASVGFDRPPPCRSHPSQQRSTFAWCSQKMGS